ncbi:MAG: cadherin domain-containing protein [Fibrobacterales bacterium]
MKKAILLLILLNIIFLSCKNNKSNTLGPDTSISQSSTTQDSIYSSTLLVVSSSQDIKPNSSSINDTNAISVTSSYDKNISNAQMPSSSNGLPHHLSSKTIETITVSSSGSLPSSSSAVKQSSAQNSSTNILSSSSSNTSSSSSSSSSTFTNSLPILSPITITLKENTVYPDPIATISATDSDSDTLVYSIATGNTENMFSLDTISGNVTINSILNYEVTDSYILSIQVNDQTDSIVQNITIKVTNTDSGSIIDPRDATVYPWVEIGEQVWMAKNLEYYIPDSSFCYSNNSSFCTKYGRLYIPDAALNSEDTSSANPSGVQGLCPDNWHLPSKDEWIELGDYTALSNGLTEIHNKEWMHSGLHLKTTTGWDDNGGGTNNYGFNGEGSGYKRDYNSQYGNQRYGYWLSTTKARSDEYWVAQLGFNHDALRITKNNYNNSYSIRCVLNNTIRGAVDYVTQFPIPDKAAPLTPYCNRAGNSCGSITDARDATTYKTIEIGTQTWMAENLRYLPKVYKHITGSEDTGNDLGYFYYIPGYSPTGSTMAENLLDAKASTNYITHGVLYNWYAVMQGSDSSSQTPSGVQGICPTGWHIPSQGEWMILINYIMTDSGLDGRYMNTWSEIGGALKGTYSWDTNGYGTDEYGFSVLASGFRTNGYQYNIGVNGYFWTSSWNDEEAIGINFVGENRIVNFTSSWENHEQGNSVRCIQDI